MNTLVEQVEAVAKGEVSVTELVESALKAVERTEDLTNAFTTVLPDDALERARQIDRPGPRGPLHGVPLVVKDLYDVTGVATTGCCAAYERVATWDATVVDKLRSAGAIVVAKSNQHELALGTSSQLSSYGPVRNPWDTGRSPGGSSGGSGAAVATRSVLLAMGSDTGGSIRIPAAFCGVTGLKPTHGAVSLRGVMPLSPSLDTAGPLAVSAADCALVHSVISGYDARDMRSRRSPAAAPERDLSDMRIALPLEWYERIAPDVAAAVRAAASVLTHLGATVTEIDGLDVEGLRDRFVPLLLAEAARHFETLIESDRVSDPTRELLRLGLFFSARDYAAAREAALELRRAFDNAFETVDALLTPTTAYVAPALDQETVEVGDDTMTTDSVGTTRFTLPVNGAGLPALAFPVGSSAQGLPMSAQLIGPAWSESRLCAIATAYQGATDHHLRAPEIS